MRNLTGSLTLFASNILVCAALYILRHSADDSILRTVYLLAANGLAGLVGFLPFRRENSIRFDRPTLAVVVWSACYCAEYGLFVVYPGAISISQLIVCNSVAPFLAVYLSGDIQRSQLTISYRLVSAASILLLLGIAYMERRSSENYHGHVGLLLCCVLVAAVASQACARYVARNRTSSWSQPRLTVLNALFLCLLIGIVSHPNVDVLPHSMSVALVALTGALVFAVQRFYVFGLKRAEPFISAMILCTIVPLSLCIEVMFERRVVSLLEMALAAAYVVATAVSVQVASQSTALRMEISGKVR